MYRPEGWVNPYKPDNENNEYYGDIGARDQAIYEAGADAYEKGLKRVAIAENHNDDDYIAIEIMKGTGLKKGWLVFIEDK
ncbi:hypothetical protein LCGC14_0365680 [marine sediment metagenome]|uniref:Uncharacterized protein n=1 Tax=marine sediment metagenome TaxID=412755 RepID=A0A0F9TPN1_9ZZZZ